MAELVTSIVTLFVFFIAVVVLPLLFSKSIKPQQILRKPSWAALTAAFFVLIGFAAAYLTFFQALSLVMVALASLMLLPYLIDIFTRMEVHSINREKGIIPSLKRHEKLIQLYVWLFFGMALEFALLYAILPPVIGNHAFSAQLSLLGPQAAFFQPDVALSIFANNLQLALIAFALSPFWGAGSLFILGYTASIAGVVYGSTLNSLIYGTPGFAVSLAFLPHTILEILGYLFAAVAGIALIRKVSKETLTDAGWLLAVGIVFIAMGAIIESGFL